MKCTIDENGLKSWGRAIHTMALLGETEMHFQFTRKALMLTSFDSSLSVCSTLSFHDTFFRQYNIEGINESQLSCRIASKCLLKPFRSLRFLTKLVHNCQIILKNDTDYLRVIFTTKMGSLLYYDLAVIPEVDALSLDFDHTELKNTLSSNPKLLLVCLSNFNYSKASSHLTLKASGNKLFLRNAATDLIKKEGKVVTELSLNPIDFSHYSVDVDGELTISMREFRTFINFAENMKLQTLSVYFESATDPFVAVVKSEEESFEAILTLATKTMREVNSTHGALSQNFSSLGSNVSIANPSLSNPETRPVTTKKPPTDKPRKKNQVPVNLPSTPSSSILSTIPVPSRRPEPQPSTSRQNVNQASSSNNTEPAKVNGIGNHVARQTPKNVSGRTSGAEIERANQSALKTVENHVLDPNRMSEREMANLGLEEDFFTTDMDPNPNDFDGTPGGEDEAPVVMDMDMDGDVSPPLSPIINISSTSRPLNHRNPPFLPFLNSTKDQNASKRRKFTTLRIGYNPLSAVPGALDVLAEDSDVED